MAVSLSISENVRKTVLFFVSFPREAVRKTVLFFVSFLREAARRTVLFFVLVRSNRALTMALSLFGRGRSPNGAPVAFLFQLVKLSQLSQSFSGVLAQPACARVCGRYAEPSGFGTALRTRGVGPPACQQARPGGCSV
jgi:hypothetical protein